MRRLWRDRSGNVAIIFALSLVPMLLAVGGAVDFSRYYDTRQTLQSALDASVLAGAAQSSTTVAAATFNAWNVKLDGAVVTPSYTGCTSSATSCVGTITTTLSTAFIGVAGINSLPLNITATAGSGSVSTASGGACVWLMHAGLWSTATLNAPTCDVDVLAGDSYLYSGARIITDKLCVASGVSVTNYGGSVVDSDGASSLSQNCTTTADPYSGKYSDPSYSGCDYTYYASYSSATMNPGVYCGGMTFTSGTIAFKPGVYIIKGGTIKFYNTLTVTGTGVVFFFADSSSYMYMTSGANVTFTAPTSSNCGTYNGINTCDYTGVLMFEPKSLSYNCSGLLGWLTCTLLPWTAASTNYMTMLEPGSTLTETGLIYMPSRYLTQDGGTMTNHGGIVLTGLRLYTGAVLNVDATTTGKGAVRLEY